MSAKNKTAIVTGAGKGIGRGIALALAKDGFNVVVADLNKDDADAVASELNGMGVEAAGVACDVSDAGAVRALFSAAAERFGRLDVLVNNAGIYPYVAFEKMTEADWDKVMDVNLKGVFLCAQAAAKVLPAGGRIVSISSVASLIGFEGLTHYCASKGAINGFTRALALELASKKITVNAVAPGAIKTPGASGGSEEQTKQTVALIPLARMGEPEDIANAVSFLASDRSGYITGQVIVVDGGWILR
jgi:NAD(P)-dependent dehydrogenase (short-subunit alcohol dehydrogenase family)